MPTAHRPQPSAHTTTSAQIRPRRLSRSVLAWLWHHRISDVNPARAARSVGEELAGRACRARRPVPAMTHEPGRAERPEPEAGADSKALQQPCRYQMPRSGHCIMRAVQAARPPRSAGGQVDVGSQGSAGLALHRCASAHRAVPLRALRPRHPLPGLRPCRPGRSSWRTRSRVIGTRLE